MQAFYPSITGTGPTNQINAVEALDGAELLVAGIDDKLRRVVNGEFTSFCLNLKSQPHGIATNDAGLSIVATAKAVVQVGEQPFTQTIGLFTRTFPGQRRRDP